MPPFIRVKMETLTAGSIDVVSNPDGAFDTDGWGELRRRIPKFRATMEHYSDVCTNTPNKKGLTATEIERLSEKLQAILHECHRFEEKLKRTQSKGDGIPRKTSRATGSKPKWNDAYGRFALVLGVLTKTNRDLSSKHWKKAWIPTKADLSILAEDHPCPRQHGELTVVA